MSLGNVNGLQIFVDEGKHTDVLVEIISASQCLSCMQTRATMQWIWQRSQRTPQRMGRTMSWTAAKPSLGACGSCSASIRLRRGACPCPPFFAAKTLS